MGTITMITAAQVPTFTLVPAEFSDDNKTLACYLGDSVSIWIPSSETFETATVIWGDANGTVVPEEGFYAVGNVVRGWNGINTIEVGHTTCDDDEKPVGIVASYDATTDHGSNCSLATTSVGAYIERDDWLNCIGIWDDVNLTTYAPAGYYVVEDSSRWWTGVEGGLSAPTACI